MKKQVLNIIYDEIKDNDESVLSDDVNMALHHVLEKVKKLEEENTFPIKIDDKHIVGYLKVNEETREKIENVECEISMGYLKIGNCRQLIDLNLVPFHEYSVIKKQKVKEAIDKELKDNAWRKKHGEKVHEDFKNSPVSLLVRLSMYLEIYNSKSIIIKLKELGLE